MAHYGPEEWFYPDGTLAVNVRAAVFGPGNDNVFAALFSDAALTVPLPNPTATDALGFLEFHVADGQYWVFVGSVNSGDSVLVTLGIPVTGVVTSVNGQVGDVVLDAADVGAVPTSRTLTAGVALSGGGDLSADRTFDVDLGTTAGTAAAGDDARITGAQQRSTIDAKGDLYAGTADNTTTRLPVGTDGQALRANSTTGTGLEWDTLTAADVGALALTGGTVTGDVLLDGATTDLTVEGTTTLTYEGVTLDVMEGLSTSLSTGMISGGLITINVDPSKIDISPIFGYIVDYTTTPLSPTLVRIDLPAQVGLAMTPASLARQITAWVVNSAGTILQIDPQITNSQNRDLLILGATVQFSGIIVFVDPIRFFTPQPVQQSLDLMRVISPFVVGGHVLTPIALSLTFSKGSGDTFAPGGNVATDPKNPHVVTSPAISPQDVRYATQLSGSSEAVTHTNVYPSNYDVGGVITPIPGSGNRATIQRVHLFTAGNGITIQYGQQFYTSLSDAIAAINSEAFVLNPDLNFAAPIALLVITKGCTDLSDSSTARFFPTGRLGGSFGSASVSAPVQSVNGFTGAVVLTSADVGAQPIATIDAKGDLYAGTANNATTRLPVGTDGQALRANSATGTGLEWDTLTAADVSAVPTTRTLTAGIALSGGGDLSADRTFDVDLGTTAGTAAAGDDTRITGAQQRSTLTTKGDLYVATASATTVRRGVGTNGQVLTADSAETDGVKWATPSAAAPSFALQPRAGVYTQAGAVNVVRSSKAVTLNAMYMLPFSLITADTLTAIAFELTSSTATAVARLGIYQSDVDNLPDALLVDFGTFTADTIGLRNVTGLSQALSANTLYWLAIDFQVAAPNVRHVAGWNPWVSSTAFPTGAGAGWNNAYVQTGVSGAFPANTGTLVDTDSPAVGVAF